MIRGTTPTHIFNIPFDTALVDEVKIIYAQDDIILFTKSIDNCTLAEQSISVTLTQEDTLMFDHSKEVQIQIRLLTKSGEAFASIIEKVGVAKCLDDEVLV